MRRALLVRFWRSASWDSRPGAAAHPLGNFRVNHLAKVKVSSEPVDVQYVLDQAEIPPFRAQTSRVSELLASKQAEVTRGPAPSRERTRSAAPARFAGQVTMPSGQGGLFTTRLELSLSPSSKTTTGAVAGSDLPVPRGLKAIVAEPGGARGARGRSIRRPHARAAAYRTIAPTVPSTAARPLSSRAGDGTSPPTRRGRAHCEPHVTRAARASPPCSTTPRPRWRDDAVLLAAFGWGALHALSPGHGGDGLRPISSDPRHRAPCRGPRVTVTVTHTLAFSRSAW